MKHYVITVARETGSGGHDITRRLSEELNIPYYDRDLLRKASEVSGIHERLFGAADERRRLEGDALRRRKGLYRRDPAAGQRRLHFHAEPVQLSGEDHQGTGRHGKLHYSGTLRQLPADGAADVRLLRLFIHAPLETRMARVASYSLAWSTHEVARYIRREDKRRAAYYHYYTGEEWRDAAGYDLSLDSQQLGEDGCVELIRNALPLFT